MGYFHLFSMAMLNYQRVNISVMLPIKSNMELIDPVFPCFSASMLWSTMINPYKIIKHHWSFLSLLPLKTHHFKEYPPAWDRNTTVFMGQLCCMVFHHHQFTIYFMVKPQSGDISWWNTFFNPFLSMKFSEEIPPKNIFIIFHP